MFGAQGIEKHLERASRSQPDGTFLVLPFLPLRIVYQVDTQTRERLVRFQLASWRLGILLTIFLIAISAVVRRPWWVVAVIAVAWLAYYGGIFVLLGSASRMSAASWQGGMPRQGFPARKYLRHAFLWAAIAAALALFSWVDLRQPGAAFPWLGLALMSLAIAIAGIFFVTFARKLQKRD